MHRTYRISLAMAVVMSILGLPLAHAAAASAEAAPTQNIIWGGRGIKPPTSLSQPAKPDSPQPECPPGLNCKFVPAAYKQVDPADKSNYGNYDLANRPADGLAINSIVIHDTEGSLASTLALFQDSASYVSAHYVIDTDGTIYQTVRTKNIAWHAGNWYTNQHSIGIEHVGFAASGQTSYTPAMYHSSAALVRYLSQKFNISLDRQHLIGHDNVQAPTAGLVAGMHWDPGPFWNWQRYMTLLGVPVVPTAGPSGQIVTISPTWATNQPRVTDCASSPCATLPVQSANFIYLRTAPNTDAPLLSDPALHPEASAGTTNIDDWSAKAVYGQQFGLAGRSGDWTAIWFAGQKGWFMNRNGYTTAVPTRGQYITPRADLATIPVYGRAYPETTAYAGTQVPVQSVVPLQYTIGAGQKYATTGPAPTDYYWAWTIDSSLPDDHTLISGHDRYLEIQLNGRIAYVKQADVTINNN